MPIVCCYPFLTHVFDKFSEKNQKIAKKTKTLKKCIFDIFASFLAFSMSSQKKLNLVATLMTPKSSKR